LQLSQVWAAMSDAGASRLYAKWLAPNDNSKNQIYLGPGFEALNVLPSGTPIADPSKEILKAPLAFSWIDEQGRAHAAPGAQLILYPQYPEVRMSGFLKGARWAPSEVMTSRAGGRLLLFGVTESGNTFGFASKESSNLARELRARTDLTPLGVFFVVPVVHRKDSRQLLLAELKRVRDKGWIRAKRLLTAGRFAPCDASNCGGYTLEAELGILPNAISEPDFLGWEVKQYGVTDLRTGKSLNPVTLFTPEPTGGYYKTHGVEAFVRKYGYPDKRKRVNRINFGGIYRANETVASTKLTMILDGYDIKTSRLVKPASGITLVDQFSNVAAIWHYTGLLAHWKRKHAMAVYVPSINRKLHGNEYRYGSRLLLAEGADFLNVLRSMACGHVYYDPAIKLVTEAGKSTCKRRSQFRVAMTRASALYERSEIVQLA